MNKNDLLFRRWYNEKIVRFIGGPLHDEVQPVIIIAIVLIVWFFYEMAIAPIVEDDE